MEEMTRLENLRKKLHRHAINLITQLKEQERNSQQQHASTLLSVPNNTDNVEEDAEKIKHLCEKSCEVTGIAFKNIVRKWLKDNVYWYKANMVTKTLTLTIELKVMLEGEEFEILDIICHFIGIDNCFILEIQSWVQSITKMKNFSLLASAISEYNIHNELRNEILHKLKKHNYGTFEKCTEGTGGYLLYIHSTSNKERKYLTFQWSLLFIEQMWRISHFFAITTVEAEAEFGRENKELLERFCTVCLQKNELLDLWLEVCCAVKDYEDEVKLQESDDTS